MRPNRSLSSVSLDGIIDERNPRVKRVKALSGAQVEAIQSLTNASQIPHAERKRQWNALHRRLKQPDLPEGLLEKWASTKTAAAKLVSQFYFHMQLEKSNRLLPSIPRFEFLKCFLTDPSLSTMHIEAFHKEPSP